MVSKKIIGIGLSLSLVLSIALSNPLMTASASTQGSSKIASGSTFSPIPANLEKIRSTMKEKGLINSDMQEVDLEKYVNQYAYGKGFSELSIPASQMDKELNAKNMQKVEKFQSSKIVNKDTSNANLSSAKPNDVQTETWNGTVKKDNILVALVDFQDVKHGQLTSKVSDFYYQDYTREHYQQMLFGDSTYDGPKGEKFVTMKKFFEEQSGGSYTIGGNVCGWYTAPLKLADYGAQVGSDHDANIRQLVKDLFTQIAADPNVDLSQYDQEDPYDIDKDGNTNEPDGIVDHFVMIHAGIGQESVGSDASVGPGQYGLDSIWSHSWTVGEEPFTVKDTKGRDFSVYHYTTDPEDGAAPVFCHEFTHDLGYPDEYDRNYSGSGEPVADWSIMSSGSWAGLYPGSEQVNISPLAKQFMQAVYGGNWFNPGVIDFAKDMESGDAISVRLDQATTKGTNYDAIRINLPVQTIVDVDMTEGNYAYWGGKGKDGTALSTSMTIKDPIDLTNAKAPVLTFKTNYDTEKGWDFASVQVQEVGKTDWTAIKGNITTDQHDKDAVVIVANGITGTSDGWVDANFDLSAYAGKKINVKFQYDADKYTFGKGIYIDTIKIADGATSIFEDNAETKDTPNMTLNGFTATTGQSKANHYYLVEWRNGVDGDAGLARIARGLGCYMKYDTGMVVWYVNDAYENNDDSALHPGKVHVGVVDADQSMVLRKMLDPSKPQYIAGTSYQLHDAAFSLRKSQFMDLKYSAYDYIDNNTFMKPIFDDSKSYTGGQNPEAGLILPKLGLKIYVTNESKDRSVGTIRIVKK